MRRLVRRLALVLVLVAPLAAHGSTASAEGAVFFEGQVYVDCFGCGSSPGTAKLCVTGEAQESAFAGCVYADTGKGVELGTGNADAAFTAVEDNDPLTCVVSGNATGSSSGGSASGLITGVIYVNFNWTRVGAIAVIVTAGQINGVGYGTFLVTSPAGIPCRSAVTALVTGVVLGS